jgi:SAM-dependent methyltransferase
LKPFEIHRRIPLLRRPFYQRDQALKERDDALGRLAAKTKALEDAIRDRDEALRSLAAKAAKSEALEDVVWERKEAPYRLASKTEAPKSAPADAPLTFQFCGYEIPVDLMLLTGGGPDTFEEISAGHIAALQKHVGLEPGLSVLEIGCGIGRDAIPLTGILSADQGGCYIGIDIIRPSIDWCNAHIQAKNHNFVFYHMNIADQLHNPQGNVHAITSSLPVPDCKVDRIILQSVFTHMLRSDVEHYLAEFRRIMKPGSLAFVTAFIYDDAILACARGDDRAQFGFRFEHELEPGCRVNSLDYPTGSVAYTAGLMDILIAKHGLRHVRPTLKGAWSGYHPNPEYGQDVLLLTTA